MFMTVALTMIVVLRDLPEANQQLIGQIQGSLWVAVGVLVNYYFGSSKQSQTKDSTIARQAEAIQTAQHLPPADKGMHTVPVEPGERIVVEGTDNAQERT